MLTRNPFIPPSVPVLKTEPPTIFTRNGNDITRRFPLIRDVLLALPCEAAIIDAELVACDSEGKPDFDGLIRRQNHELCIWCFDLLSLDGVDMRPEVLRERKRNLEKLVHEADEHTLRYSAEFSDPIRLLEVAEQWKLEGVVSKKADQPYRSGKHLGWIKVKTASWRVANLDRWELSQRQAR